MAEADRQTDRRLLVLVLIKIPYLKDSLKTSAHAFGKTRAKVMKLTRTGNKGSDLENW